MDEERASSKLTISSTSFSRPKNFLVLGRSLKEVTNCFSICLDKSLSINSAESNDKSILPLSSIYLKISTCLNGKSVNSNALTSGTVSTVPSEFLIRTGCVLTLSHIPLATFIPSSVRKYAFLLRDTPVTCACLSTSRPCSLIPDIALGTLERAIATAFAIPICDKAKGTSTLPACST